MPALVFLALAGSATTTSHEQHTHGEPQHHRQDRPDRATSCNRSGIPGEGVRIGEALGLRHDDLAIAERQVTVEPRLNDNRARAKAGRSRTIPASAELMRLYSDYLHREYGVLDSDYVFVNLFAEPHGHPWAYPAVYDLVKRLRKATGIAFEPHQYRHTYATWLQMSGVAADASFDKISERLLPATSSFGADHGLGS